MTKKREPEVTRHGLLDAQVCVPAAWTDAEVLLFAESAIPCGTRLGWSVRKSKRLLRGDPERVPCAERKGFVHITLDA